MRIIFMGTPDFAVPSLKKLIDDQHEIAAVFTQPDKKVGRKQILTPPPVKQLALQYSIHVYQPATLKDGKAFDLIREISPDLIVVAAYGKILPENILNVPAFGCINVHASLLPKYRGAAPIQRAVLNGESETGICIMQMDEGLDTGDILYTLKTDIGIDETSAELFYRLAVSGADALSHTIALIKNGKAVPQKQSGEPSYAHMIDKSMCNIDWNKSAFEVHNQIRGLQTWPCAQTIINGRVVKIHSSRLSDISMNCVPGTVISSEKELVVSCGDGRCVSILSVQPTGKKKMEISSFLAGNRIPQGTVLGE